MFKFTISIICILSISPICIQASSPKSISREDTEKASASSPQTAKKQHLESIKEQAEQHLITAAEQKAKLARDLEQAKKDEEDLRILIQKTQQALQALEQQRQNTAQSDAKQG